MKIDEQALEIAAKRIYEDKGDRKGIEYVGWDQETDEVKRAWRLDTRVTIDAYLRAANENKLV